MSKTVAVGLSGGVDSTMAALMLLKQGYRVIGLTMSIWDDQVPLPESQKSGCFGPGEADDIEAAKSICTRLNIPHYVIELKNEYRDNVLNYFCDTYLEGKTPNPCVFCNQRLKFGMLPQRAKEQGLKFDIFATGHYVRTYFNQSNNRWQLLRANDLTKDQSYFLTFLSQDQLGSVLFPLGEVTKKQIKKLARDNGFTDLVEKPESQDFLETDDYSILFDKNRISSGNIVDIDGKVIGKHKGLIYYTIGQRKNLGIPGQIEPFYVLELDASKNQIIVGPKQYLYKTELVASSLNWISIDSVYNPFTALAKIRLQHEPASCIITPRPDKTVKVVFDEPQMSITPGQIVVFYDKDIVLGGGIIN